MFRYRYQLFLIWVCLAALVAELALPPVMSESLAPRCVAADDVGCQAEVLRSCLLL